MEGRQLESLLAKLELIRQRTEDRGFTQAEAEAAAEKMNALLLNHNIDMMQLEAFANRTNREVISEKLKADAALWKFALAGIVAEAHLCKAVSRRVTRGGGGWDGGGRVYTVYGHSHNLIVFRDVYEWLLGVISEATELAHQQAKASENVMIYWDARHHARSWKSSYRIGFISGLQAAFARARKTTEENASEWALVPVLEQEVEDAVKEKHPILRSVGSLTISHDHAYLEGYLDGDRVNTDRQVRGSERAANLPSG